MNIRKFGRYTLYAIIGILALLLIGPFLYPVPPLENVSPVQDLAYPDSLFIEVSSDSLDPYLTHYNQAGAGDTAIILLHGFGSSAYSWSSVIDQFGSAYQVFAYDRPAFGLTERLDDWELENPYSLAAAVEQLHILIDKWDLDQVILVGNSAGGGVAMNYTLEYPDKVQALILVSPAVGGSGGGRYSYLRPIINTPQMQRLGPLLVREIQEYGMDMLDEAWHDIEKRPEETINAYRLPLQAEYWDGALWHYSTIENHSEVRTHLTEFTMPLLILTGDDDRIVPTANTVNLAADMPNAKLVLLSDCGHVPQEECPNTFLDSVSTFLTTNLP